MRVDAAWHRLARAPVLALAWVLCTVLAMALPAHGTEAAPATADPALEARWAAHEQGYEPAGIEPGPESLRSAVGLVWRSVVLWISLFAMLNAANWLGR